MWKIKAFGERVHKGNYELELFISYHETEFECFEWLIKLKDKENYYIKEIHVERVNHAPYN
jgi:hypothetical protein